jgi:hypothetical protein
MITVELNNAWSGENVETRQAVQELFSKVMASMVQFYGQTLSGRQAQKALRKCFNIAEESFAAICSRHGVEFWLPFIRKRAEMFHGYNDETYATLSLLKYTDADDQGVIPINKTGSITAISLLHEPQDLVDVDRLIYLASLMGVIGNTYRRVGKGSELIPSEQFPIFDRASFAVETAMWTYDDRRPAEASFRDQGTLRNVQWKGQGIHFMGLARVKGRRFVVPDWNDSWPCLRLLAPFAADSWIQILEAYREAIEDLYETRLDSLFHFLSGLNVQILNNVPGFDGAKTGDIRLVPHKGESEEKWKVEVQFLLHFTDKGYFRFPLGKWLKMMTCIRSPWADSDAESRRLTEAFFRGFSLNEDRRVKIDVSTMRPMPFCFKTSANWVYVDVQATADFLAHLLQSAKDWFATQHGDRFTFGQRHRASYNGGELQHGRISRSSPSRCKTVTQHARAFSI